MLDSNEDILARRRTSLSQLNLQSCVSSMIETIAKSLGRRIYELVKGHKNKHLMIIKQELVESQRGKLVSKDDTIIGLETTKALILQDIKASTMELDSVKDKLRQEQENCASVTKQHKALSQQLRKVVADCKS